MKVSGGLVKRQQNGLQESAKPTFTAMLNTFLDRDGYRKRFDELLGKRAPQFISSVVSLVNSEGNLKKAFSESPITVIQSCLKAATYDLPIDPGLGYAYIVPFKNKKDDGHYAMEASFVMGYKGMIQLALRSGCYSRLNVVDVREGELVHYDRLTEDVELAFIEDEEERDQKPVIGYCGFFRLVNGMEKTIYMSKKQVEKHEEKNRKGKYMGKGWRNDFDAMARKTVLRQLIGRWGLMSINYQNATPADVAAAEAIAKGEFDDTDTPITIDPGTQNEEREEIPFPGEEESAPANVNPETGEIK